jgi:hypothetical protein
MKAIGGRIFQSVSVGVQLAAVKRNMLRLGLGGLEIDHAVRSIDKLHQAVELTGEITGGSMSGQYNGGGSHPAVAHLYDSFW